MRTIKLSQKDIFASDSIKAIALGFQTSRVLLTAYELGLFTALGEKSKTAAQVAGILKSDSRSTDRLMNVLCTLGLLKKRKNRFSNTPSASRFLVKGSPHFMAGLMHAANMWDIWCALTQAVRDGKSKLAKRADRHGRKWLNAFIAAMHERACQQAGHVVSLLNLSGVSRMLDVGGGSGAYAMAFVRAKNKSTAVVFDLPAVVPLTRNYIRHEGLSKKIKTISGDYARNDFGGGFDLIFLSAIVHSNSFAQSQALINKCARALNPRGQVVVQDFIMNEDRTKPIFGALFALNMLVATQSGDTYTESEVRRWMREAGLLGIQRKDTDFGTALMIGRKKA